MAKQWFVILQESEIMSFKNPFERLVYESIKSFCGNGKIEAALSTREIASRANVSHMTVREYLPILLGRGFIKITGEEKRVGGSVPRYKVYAPLTVSVSPSYTLSKESVSPAAKSVSPRSESVSGVGTKSYKVKSNKVSNAKDIIGNAEKNTKVGLPKEPTPGFGGLHWSEFADKLSDYHFSKEIKK